MTSSAPHCPHCGGSTAGCSTVQSLSGRTCCQQCPGHHDQESNR